MKNSTLLQMQVEVGDVLQLGEELYVVIEAQWDGRFCEAVLKPYAMLRWRLLAGWRVLLGIVANWWTNGR